ncbi:MAG: DMT family transporter [Muricomes sp.]
MTKDRKIKMKGCLFAFVTGALWGISSPVGQFLFENKNITPEWLVPYRMLLAGSLLLIYAKIRGQDILSVWKDKRDAVRLLVFGVTGMLGMQYVFFSAVHAMNAGTATVFQYLNPAILILFFAVVHKIMPSKKEMISVIISITGIFLVATHGNFSTLAVSPRGLFFGILLAVVTCLYGVVPIPLLRKYSAETVSAWGMLIGGAVLTVFTQPWKIKVEMDSQIVAAFAFIIVVGTVLPFCFYLSSVKYAGAVYAGLFSCSEPVAATIVAAVYLGTKFAKVDIVGFVLVLSTLFILAIPDKTK